MKSRRSSHLLALGSAAVLTVYTAGYARTKPAADQLAAANNERRPPPRATDVEETASSTSNAPVVASPSTTSPPTPAVAPPRMPAEAKVAPTMAMKAEQVLDSVPTPVPVVVTEAAASVPATSTGAASTIAPPLAVTPTTSTPPPAAAPLPTTEAAPPTVPVKPVWRDGAYIGRGRSRHGDIEAMVEIKEGKITYAVISQCLTQYSCGWINHLLPQVVSRQSADVDYVSGATQSANALYYAVLQALAQAK